MAVVNLQIAVDAKSGQASILQTAAAMDKVTKAQDSWTKGLAQLKQQQDPWLRGMAAMSAQTLKTEQAASKAKLSLSGMAGSLGQISTTLARSVGILGLSSTSLRALDDAADIAQLGLLGVEGGFKKAAFGAAVFNAATLGIVAAVAAISVALGTFLRWLGETDFGMKTLGLSTKELDADFRELLGVIEAGPDKDFTADMAAKRTAGVQQQIESLRAAGATIDDIAKTSGSALKAMLDPLSESGKIAMLKEFGFSTAEVTKLIPALTDNLKPLTDAQNAAAAAAKAHADEMSALASSISTASLEQELAKMAEAAALAAARGDTLTSSGKQQISDLVGTAIAEGIEIPAELMAVRKDVIAGQLQQLVEDSIAQVKVKKGASEDLWKKVLGGGLEGGVGATGPVQDMIDRATESEKQAALAAEANAKATFDWAQQLQDVANLASTLPGLFGQSLSAILGGVSAIGASLKNIGGMKGLGGALSGKSGIGGIFAGLGTVGTIIGGAVGIFKGIKSLFGGDDKAKAEELKKKQQAAIDSFTDLYNQWVEMRQELAGTGAAGATSIVDSMFEDGKFNEKFTSAGNAAEYVVASFNALVAAGLSVPEAFAKLKPALDAMGKDFKKFAGTAAAPLIQMAKFASENEKLLQFQAGLADVAVGLAAVNQLTQDLANKLSVDMANSIQSMIDKGLSYDQALAMSAENLFKLQQAAEQGKVTLDSHTQQMIDDAKAGGLFEGLQDPMQRLIQLQGAMVAAMGQLIQLMGGAVPAAIQRMIDEFNNAQVSISVNVDVPGGVGGGAPGAPDELGLQKAAKGLTVEPRPGGTPVILGEANVREHAIPDPTLQRMLESAASGGGRMRGGATINVYAQRHQNPRQIAEEANRRFRLNRGASRTQDQLGAR